MWRWNATARSSSGSSPAPYPGNAGGRPEVAAPTGLLESRDEPHRLHVSTTDDLAQSRVTLWVTGPDESTQRARDHAVWVEPHLDNILQLLDGDLEAIVNAIGQPWDHAPWVILTEEAGGRFHDGRGGRRIDQGTGVYTNGRIDQQLERLLER